MNYKIDVDWNDFRQDTLSFTDAYLSNVKANLNVDMIYKSRLIFINVNNKTIKAIETRNIENFDSNGNIQNGKVYYHKFDGTYLIGYKVINGKTEKRLLPKKKMNTANFFSFFTLNDDCKEQLNPNNTFCDQDLDAFTLTATKSTPPKSSPVYYYILDHPTLEKDSYEGETRTGGGGSGGGEQQNGDENCPEGQIKDANDNCVTDPCKFVKLQIQNPNYTAQANELKTKTGLKKETGYKQNKDGTQVPLTANSNGHELIIPIDRNTIGYMHTHLDNFISFNTKTGNQELKKPIRMFSPTDVIKFLQILRNTRFNGTPSHLVYGTMISSSGNYTLRYTGTIDSNFSSSINALNSAQSYRAKYENYIKDKGSEKGLLQFLKEVIKIKGVNLYKIKNNGEIVKKTLDSDGKINNNNC